MNGNISCDSNDYQSLLDYINDCTVKFTLAAEDNFKKLPKCGVSSDDVEKISLDTNIDKVISSAVKNRMTDMLLSNSCVVPVLSDSVFQSINENTMKREIIRNIFKVQHHIKELHEIYSTFDRELLKLKKQKLLAEKDLQDESNYSIMLEEYEEELEELKRETEIPENDKLRGILDKIKTLDASISESSVKIQNVSKKLEKYGDLPANILMAKCKLAEAEETYKDMRKNIDAYLNSVNNVS